ncbi:MAG: hypothetical protein LUC92_01220 [Clostridiales bacterium]|nr:hypothetical protein [Clostridiales bacterium]
MTQNEREKLISLLTSAVRTKLCLSLLNLSNDLTLPSEGEPKAYKPINKELIALLPQVKEGLKSNESDVEASVKALMNIKEKAVKAARPVYSLMNFNGLLEEMLKKELRLRTAVPNGEDKNLKAEDVTEVLHGVLHECLNTDNSADILSIVMGAVPCRLTKAKFNDYIKEAIAIDTDFDFKGNPLALDEFEAEVIPFKNADCEAFPGLYDNYMEILASDIKNMSEETLEQIIEKIRKDSLDIFDTADYLSMIYSDANYMISMLLYGYDLDFITNGNLIMKDLFYSAAEYALNENPDEIDTETAEKINEDTETHILKLRDEDEKVLKNIQKTLEKYKDDDTPLDENDTAARVFTILQIVDINFNAELSAYIFEESNTKDIEEIAEAFADDFEKATASVKPYVKKILRQKAMSLLSSPYSLHQAMDYITAALEASEGTPAFFAGAEEVINIINFLEEDAKHQHHHHHHGDDCDCGCGHDHHHEHEHSHHFEKHI